jgi:NifU-like protein
VSQEVQAKQFVDEILRPLLAADGGEIELVSMQDKQLVVRMKGMCSGCPGRPYTLSEIIEPAARKYLGADVQVVATDE